METIGSEQITEEAFAGLESRITELLRVCDQLREENHLLRQQQAAFTAERASLIEKNELAKSRVEEMINRLKSLEHSS